MDEYLNQSLHGDGEHRRSGADYSGVANAGANTAASQMQLGRLHAAQGHGYAAEHYNHLYDVLTGNEASIVGNNNAKNGADRLVNGIYIQTKYCKTASDSVSAAFENNTYRYINPDGSLMQLEVPSDQYERAVELVAKRIEQGQLPGVIDPGEAKDIVRKGHFTYRQAQNLVKAGTIESITYDAVTGAITATCALGITAVLTFAQSLWNGDSLDIAIENAVCSGIQIGGAVFLNTIITQQLLRTNVLTAPTKYIVNLIGPKASTSIANMLRPGALVSGSAAMNSLSIWMRTEIVTTVVMTVLLSAKDISNAFRGRISGKQLFKNMTVTVGGVAGGTIGYCCGKFLLQLVAPGVGDLAVEAIAIVSAAAVSSVSSSATNAVIGRFIEDDAVEMVRIIESSFCRLAQDYMLTEEELEIVLDDLKKALEGEALLDMFASDDREEFADTLVSQQIERTIGFRFRPYVALPDTEQFIKGIGRLVEDAEHGNGIFRKTPQNEPDPVETAWRVTGRVYSPRAARKGYYAVKQMNMAGMHEEDALVKMKRDNEKAHAALVQIRSERAALEEECLKYTGDEDKAIGTSVT